MRVRTVWNLPHTEQQTWGLLCSSQMSRKPYSPLFHLGLPRPVECRIPEGEGGVDRERRCISDTGSIQQRISVWEPNSHLRFHMVRSDLAQSSIFDELVEDFHLEKATRTTTRVTRITTARLKSRYYALCPFVKVGFKTVHGYVFSNWAVNT